MHNIENGDTWGIEAPNSLAVYGVTESGCHFQCVVHMCNTGLIYKHNIYAFMISKLIKR